MIWDHLGSYVKKNKIEPILNAVHQGKLQWSKVIHF